MNIFYLEPFSAGQGSKICPRIDRAKTIEPHCHATRALLQERLHNDRQARLDRASPSRDIFQKTAALVAVLRKLGCAALLCEETVFESDEEEARDALVLYRKRHRRGYKPKDVSCEGRLHLSYDFKQQPYIK